MKSKIPKQKRVSNKERHIRWNWEVSPDQEESIRVHYVIVDNKNREGTIERILTAIQNKSIINNSFNKVRSEEGKVKNTDFRYLFVSYDTLYSQQYVNPSQFFSPVKKDSDLVERTRTNIEDYVANIYER
tara:strand:+ start:302 stop:691 length:390 start_codon:yes stop_codon:yes gene_type:complete